MKAVPEIADVVELQAWAEDQPYSISALQDDLEAALPGDEADRAEDYAREVFEEVAQRARLLGQAYPFTYDGITLAPNDRKANSSYLFCLGLNFLGDITMELRTREFEAVVKVAAEGYFRGQAVRIGAPWATGEITDYRSLLQKVSDLIPDLGPPTRDEAPGGGDAGWDVVVVNNFKDRKFSRIIALGNCATGKTDWRRKGLETQPTLFWSFFTRPPQSENVCLTFIAVPFIMTEEDRLRKTGEKCIIFDRIRICEHSPSTSPEVMEWLDSQRPRALDEPLI
jgi:hypothetical protein